MSSISNSSATFCTKAFGSFCRRSLTSDKFLNIKLTFSSSTPAFSKSSTIPLLIFVGNKFIDVTTPECSEIPVKVTF